MTSKERAELKSQAMVLDSIFQIGKASLYGRSGNGKASHLHGYGVHAILRDPNLGNAKNAARNGRHF